MSWWSYGPYQWQDGWPSWQPQQGVNWHSWHPEQQQWAPAPERRQQGGAPAPGDGSRTRRRSLVLNFLKSRHTEMVLEYNATHVEGQDDFDICAWCIVHCSPESYERASAKRAKNTRTLTASEVNTVRQTILQHYFATIICKQTFRRHISIV